MSGDCESLITYYRVEVFAAKPGTWIAVGHKYRGDDALELAMECAAQFHDGVSTRIYEVTERRIK